MKKPEPDMTHMKAIALDLRTKGYETNYLGEVTPGIYGVYIQNRDLTKTMHLHCSETRPHIIMVQRKKFDLNDPDSIPQIYQTVDEGFKEALQSIED